MLISVFCFIRVSSALSMFISFEIFRITNLGFLGDGKMPDGELARSIEEALKEIVKTTDKSGNMKKELKKTIYEHVSTLRNLFVKMKEKLEEGMRLKEQMGNGNNRLKTEIDLRRSVANNTDTESN